MKKTILRSTILLILISIGAKALSFIVRILLARTLSPSAMNFYSLASPTLVFVITLAQMGIPSALSKVIAQSRHALKPLMASTLLSIINNLAISIVYIVLLPFLAV
ncbi:MAG: oligosaccharide flippase family protein, partial [Longicatena sp.]